MKYVNLYYLHVQLFYAKIKHMKTYKVGLVLSINIAHITNMYVNYDIYTAQGETTEQ